MTRAAVLLALLAGCRCGGEEPGAGTGTGTGAGAGADARIETMPSATPRYVVALERDPLVPEIDVHGPVIVEGVAVVSGSAIGAAGIEVETGKVLWQRGAQTRISNPVGMGRRVMLVGDCRDPIGVACYEVIDARDQAGYGAGSIVADGKLGAGATTLVVEDGVAWLGREGTWMTFEVPEPPRGEVRAAVTERRERLTVGAGEERVELWIVDDVLEMRHHRPDVMTPRSAVKDVLGAGGLHVAGPDQVRAFRSVEGEAKIQPVTIAPSTIDIDPLGPAVPGIQLLAAAHAARGFAIVVREDATLKNDYVAAFAADGTLAWTWRLPPPPGAGRGLPVGIAMSERAVVVFHDGATVAILPPP